MSAELLNAPAPETKDVAAEFRRLAEWWERETCYHSSLSIMYEHPAYRAIVALGRPVIPILLRQIETDPSWLIGALWELTGENPVPPEHRGRLTLMATDWVNWGRQNGYVW
jgi:hypothetical protein